MISPTGGFTSYVLTQLLLPSPTTWATPKYPISQQACFL